MTTFYKKNKHLLISKYSMQMIYMEVIYIFSFFSFQVKMVKTKSGIWIRILNDGPRISFFNYFLCYKISYIIVANKNPRNE